jgi:hypothetical protein
MAQNDRILYGDRTTVTVGRTAPVGRRWNFRVEVMDRELIQRRRTSEVLKEGTASKGI